MSTAKQASAVTLPDAKPPFPTVLEFLAVRFPNITPEQWAERLHAGKIQDMHGRPLDAATAYRPGLQLHYFREVEDEPVIPFAEQILFQNDEILVACKPHFLPVIPGGRYVNECLLNRLRQRTGIEALAPVHRIDRETAGIVVFSVNPATRGAYHELFMRGTAEKTYEALAELPQPPQARTWRVENRIVRGEPRFRMQTAAGLINARSLIELVEIHDRRGRFRLQPLTGKTHQLRVHMSGLGFGILHDRIYPTLHSQRVDDFTEPLQLLAKRLRFCDPLSGETRVFESARELLLT